MLRRLLIAILVGIISGAGVAWYHYGPMNGPSRPPSADQWEALMRQRIKLPEGYKFEIFAKDLGTPRLLQLTAGGDLIVSGYWTNSIILLKRDSDGEGHSDRQIVLKANMQLPHGLLLEGGTLFVAEEKRVLKYDFDGTALTKERVVLDNLPVGGNHTSRTIGRGPDGFLYLSIGSSCNSCIEDNPWRAAILRLKEGEAPEIYASGLRNTVGFDWQPGTGALFGVDNGRDNLGDDVPDDEVNRIERGKHYGWPFVHGYDVHDPSLYSKRPAALATVLPVHGLGAHVAPLSIVFLRHQADATLNGNALVTEHGSWNRTKKVGYRIVRLAIEGGKVTETVFLSGCQQGDDVICRPVGILEAPDGSLFVSDDYMGAIYHITKSN